MKCQWGVMSLLDSHDNRSQGFHKQTGQEVSPGARRHGTETPDQRPIRVLLADDHAVVRQGLARLLRDQADIDVVGEATDGQEAVALTHELLPDVVVMDVNMPKANGFDATRRITAEFPGVKIIALTVYKSPDMEGLLLQAGATAYLSKDGPFDDLLDAIRSCVAG